jgi:hypothetical protein
MADQFGSVDRLKTASEERLRIMSEELKETMQQFLRKIEELEKLLPVAIK